MSAKELDAALRQNKNYVLYENKAMSIKINFLVKGFKQVERVILQKCGIFGYYLCPAQGSG